MIEEWKDIEGYEGAYQISNLGRVKSLRYHRGLSEQILKSRHPKNAYAYVSLSINSKIKVAKIHRLVATYFVPNPLNKQYVNHIDGNKDNNMPSNLEWVTVAENNIHKYRVLRKHPMTGRKWSKNKMSRPIEQYDGQYYLATYASSSVAAMINSIDQRSILYCCNGKYEQAGGYQWKYVEGWVREKGVQWEKPSKRKI